MARRARQTQQSRGAVPRASRAAAAGPPAQTRPVARIAVDVSLAHLDRPFDYLVPERLSEAAQPGVRVKVRFAGQLTSGYLLERAAASDHAGRLAYLERVVSPEPVLSPGLAALAREVADRYAGTLADVLRLAIPPRHAAAERRQASAGPASAGPAGAGGAGAGGAGAGGAGAGTQAHRLPLPVRPDPGPWSRYPAGAAFLSALADGRAPRAVWSALPGQIWPEEIARAAVTAAAAGRGVLIVVPDAEDLGLVDAALADLLGRERHVCLAAGTGPAERYRRWLAVSRGDVRVVAGTRAAMFAPVRDLGLVVIWDDGDDLHAEPRAPYPHARDVLVLRAHRARAAALVGAFARTAEAASLLASGWAAAITSARSTVHRYRPQIRAAGADGDLAQDVAARSARIPSLALRTARDGLSRGPVLVQVPRAGYITAVACENCRRHARCASCAGPLALEEDGNPASCRWCGKADPRWRCPSCGHPRIRAVVTGAGRTAEELRKAFPRAGVLVSGGAHRIAAVPDVPALVVATPGAEPRVEGERGYAAAVLLDGWILLGRASLRASEEALRRWLNAAALVAPGASGGRVTVVADAGLPAVQALIRWDPVTHAERELAERTELRFPPAAKMAAVTGPDRAVAALLEAAALPPGAEVLGPIVIGEPGVPGETGRDGRHGPGGERDEAGRPGEATDPPGDTVRVLIRVHRTAALALATALRSAQGVRAARKDAGLVRLHLDPVELI